MKKLLIKRNEAGITLIALISTVIIMLILAGVSISGLTSDGGLFEKTSYAKELFNFSQIREGIELYDIFNIDNGRELPVGNNVTLNELNNNQKLKREIGYYRVYMMTGERPVLPQDFSGDFIETPSGIADLYYLDADKLGINIKENYIYDVVNGEIYNTNGIKLKGKVAYSESGMKEIMNSEYVPSFVEQIVMPASPASNTGAGYDFRFANIATIDTNLYKIYNNGDVYAIGERGVLLNSSEEEIESLSIDKWEEIKFNNLIDGFNKINIGSQIYRYSQILINDLGEAYVSGENGRNFTNKFGLSQDVLETYSTTGLNKLDFPHGKIKRIFTGDDTTFIITEDNKLYACGINNNGQLGIGNDTNTEEYQEVQGITEVEKIKNIHTYNELRNIIIELEDNRYYFSGSNYYCEIGDGRSSSYKTNTFVQIWNSGESDIDQDIKKLVLLCYGAIILKNDGTLLLASSYSRFQLTDFIGTDTTKFRTLENAGEKNVTDAIPHYGIGFVIEKTINGEKVYYGYSYSSPQNIGIGEKDFSVEEKKLYEIVLPTELKNEGVKEFNNVCGRKGLMFISNAGNVYYTGEGGYSGIEGQTSRVLTVTKLPINNIDSFYKMDTNYGLTYAYLQGKDGKIYTIQNPLVQLGNPKYNYTFKNIMSNVKQIAVTEGRIAYLTNDKKLYVAGNNKSVLGLGTNETSKQINPVEVIDTNISNRVKQVYMATNFYVLTDDNRLYGTGAAGTSGNASPGWSEQTFQTSFVEILSDVEGFYTVSDRKIAYNQEKVWIWYGGRTWGTSYNTPYEILLSSISSSLVNNVKDVVCNIDGYVILTKDGQVWSRGSIPYSGTTANHSNFKQIPQSSFDNKKVVKVVTTGGDKRPFIALTEDGKLYGWGNDSSILGLGITSAVAQNTPTVLPIDNVADIIATYSGFIVTKKNGEVWATGINASGIFGRWINTTPRYARTINQTAYVWVRCPALEK